MNRVGLFLALAASAAGASPSAGPRALAGVSGGLWEISKSADGHGGTRRCLPDAALLAQWEHLGGRCTRVVIADAPGHATIHYTCADGGHGRSDIRVLTPRSLRIATQGISQSYPFNYTLFARRIGNCPTR